MALPQWQWVQKSPDVTSDYAKMMNRVWIRRNRPVSQRITSAGGTPPLYDDFMGGIDGTGIDAEIRQPRAEEVALAGMKGVERLTHVIKMRYDSRVKIGMQVKYIEEGTEEPHYCIINTITPVEFRFVWMLLGCTEEVKQT